MKKCVSLLIVAASVAWLAGCATAQIHQPESLESFLDRLRTAVAARDTQTMTWMMSPQFVYRTNPVGLGYGAFQYWDQNHLWPQVQEAVSQRFVPMNGDMVSPPDFPTNPYGVGPHAGVKNVNGVWQFVFFGTALHRQDDNRESVKHYTNGQEIPGVGTAIGNVYMSKGQ